MTAPAPCKCPTCGGPLPDVPLAALKLAVPPTMARVLDVVARRPGLSAYQIAEAIYALDPNGGPEFAPHVISVVTHRANKTLAPMGWRVRSRAGRGTGGYRLERVS